METLLVQKNLVLFPETGPVKMCVRIYIFNFLKKHTRAHTHTQNKETRAGKAKETTEEKIISAKNPTGYDNIVCKFALCTFKFLDQAVNFYLLFK